MVSLQIIGFLVVLVLLIAAGLCASGHLQINVSTEEPEFEDGVDQKRVVRWYSAIFLMFVVGFAAGWLACYVFLVSRLAH